MRTRGDGRDGKTLRELAISKPNHTTHWRRGSRVSKRYGRLKCLTKFGKFTPSKSFSNLSGEAGVVSAGGKKLTD